MFYLADISKVFILPCRDYRDENTTYIVLVVHIHTQYIVVVQPSKTAMSTRTSPRRHRRRAAAAAISKHTREGRGLSFSQSFRGASHRSREGGSLKQKQMLKNRQAELKAMLLSNTYMITFFDLSLDFLAVLLYYVM